MPGIVGRLDSFSQMSRLKSHPGAHSHTIGDGVRIGRRLPAIPTDARGTAIHHCLSGYWTEGEAAKRNSPSLSKAAVDCQGKD